jgi:hypothetical protein
MGLVALIISLVAFGVLDLSRLDKLFPALGRWRWRLTNFARYPR